MKGETEEAHRRALTEDLDLLERSLIEKSGVIPVSFAYPFGAYDETSEEVVKSKYEAIFTCYERVNLLVKGDREKLSRLWRINRDGTLSTPAFLSKHRLDR